MVSFAAITDVSLSGNTITVGGINLTVSGTAHLDSITVSGSNLSVIMSKGAQLIVTSADKRTFTVSPSQYESSFVCNTSQSELTVSNNIWDTAVTITITPDTTTCSVGGGVSGSSGSSSSGGGGGGGGVPTPVYTVIPGTSVTTPASTVASPSAVAVSVSPVFSGTFKKGASNSDIKRLQILLNSDPDTRISSTGAGSPGNETDYYGNLTIQAVQKFQKKYDIVSSGTPETTGYGLLGPKTRAKIAEVFAQVATTPAAVVAQPSAQAVSVSPVFSGGMAKGQSSADIKRLQVLLNSDPDTRIASAGAGSPGSETELFGSLTEKAIEKFQEKYGIAKKGDAGYGYVGPKTRAKINEVFSATPATPATPTVSPATPATPASTGATDAQAEAIQTQINAALEQIKLLQEQLKTAQ